MKNFLHERQHTSRGHIIYKRKKNNFARSDLLRIARSLEIPQYLLSTETFDLIATMVASRGYPAGTIEFGGGEFGGGGATRSFSEPKQARITIIIEEKE